MPYARSQVKREVVLADEIARTVTAFLWHPRRMLEYNYSSGRREARFKIQGGKGDVHYDEEYYRAPFVGQSSFYDVSYTCAIGSSAFESARSAA